MGCRRRGGRGARRWETLLRHVEESHRQLADNNPLLFAETLPALEQPHIDLQYVLPSLGYKGGLKRCEKRSGLDRGDLANVDGYFAVLLWHDYQRHRNPETVETLLAYDIRDVVNLEPLLVKAYKLKAAQTPFGPVAAIMSTSGILGPGTTRRPVGGVSLGRDIPPVWRSNFQVFTMDDPVANKPRRSRTRRILLTVLLLLGALSVVFVLIEHYRGERVLAAMLEELQGRGEVLDFARIAPPPVPPASNALDRLIAASVALQFTEIALRRFQLLHSQLPRQLDELVPEFLMTIRLVGKATLAI